VNPDESAERRGDIGWGRALLSGLAIVVVVLGVTVLGANAVLTRLTGVSRQNREYLASALFLAIVVAAAWGLRRLQARGLI
jgi:hypothetical protein